ncbi:hypothetical protein [Phenylobacterium sp.]|jgi:hypothetical protein|uniref:hypothetical protein n=1 Tax=Phenylobacterium sp. TaxID=1871053 RepID=UPI002E35448A|nr:hypothetical protein [Phenylobacterium sp.]HEX4710321.1 hypothetical protein [Phenylobacterium sp.]
MLAWISSHHILLIAIVLTAILAVWKGGWAERVGGLTNLALAAFFTYAQFYLAPGGLPTAELCADGLAALIFLALAVRFASWWLGATMLLQGAQFSLHAYYYVTERHQDFLWALVNNTVSWGVVWCILAGVVASWRKGARIARSESAA